MDDLRTYATLVLEHNYSIEPSTGCWLFIGNRKPNGYGFINWNMKSYTIHRLSAWIYLGLDLEDETKQVNHKCKHKHCFNPEHLYIGTQSQNLHDYYGPIEERFCPSCGKRMTPDNVYVYRSRYGKVFRWCRNCRSNKRKAYWKKKRQ